MKPQTMLRTLTRITTPTRKFNAVQAARNAKAPTCVYQVIQRMNACCLHFLTKQFYDLLRSFDLERSYL